MKFNVHVFTIVRVKVCNIVARSHKAAVKKAIKTDFYDLFQSRPDVEWSEEHSHYLVDPIVKGVEDFDHSEWLGDDLEPMINHSAILEKILATKSLVPLLLGIDPELDRYIEKKLQKKRT